MVIREPIVKQVWKNEEKSHKKEKITLILTLNSQNKALPCILNKPCQNNGVCADDNAGGFFCTCENGYTGKKCETG